MDHQNIAKYTPAPCVRGVAYFSSQTIILVLPSDFDNLLLVINPHIVSWVLVFFIGIVKMSLKIVFKKIVAIV